MKLARMRRDGRKMDGMLGLSRIAWRRNPVPPERRLSRDAVTSLIIHGCFQFGASMSGLFLNLYLWRLTGDLLVNGVYNIIVFFVTPCAFALGGWLAKKKDRMVTYRLGIVLIALFYLGVILAQERVVDFYVGFAVFSGLAQGFYWTGYLVLMYDVSTDTNRIRFLAINMMVFNAAGLAGPALAGYIIQLNEGLSGYVVTFGIAFVSFFVAAIISFRIPVIDSHHRTYYLKLVGAVLKRNRQWLLALIGFLVMGLLQGIMLFLPNILLFQTVGREDRVGYLGVLFAFLTVVTGYMISRKAREEHAHRYVTLSSLGVIAGASVLLIDISAWSVVTFMIVFSLCNPLTVNTLTSYYYRIMGTLPLKGQLRIESVVMRELFLNAGRVISISLLLVFAGGVDSAMLPIVLVAAALIQLNLIWLVKRR
ncbi:MFS transporter [Paenibacillus sp. 598K]|uniref:MFS transporter n=1 Tax=Paenibacillus sp. 598K TaxID=1117987 RepID=UPI000FF91319|nr:MFS transporter [Paenibacillus sp. 598K]GBF75232.1 MFS transporter [Paenibacillus sp. 598K]